MISKANDQALISHQNYSYSNCLLYSLHRCSAGIHTFCSEVELQNVCPLAHFRYEVKAPSPMSKPSQKHKNQLRVCLYFTHQNLVGIGVYLLPKHLLNQFCSHPHHLHCFSSISYFNFLIFLPLYSYPILSIPSLLPKCSSP